MQNPFLLRFLWFMCSGQGSGHSGQMMQFLLPDAVISKRERLEELLEWELI